MISGTLQTHGRMGNPSAKHQVGKSLCVLGLALFTWMSSTVHAQSASSNPSHWELVWADEFNTDGLPNTKNWSFDTQGNDWDWGNDEIQNYTPASNNNAWIKDGALTLEARRQDWTWSGDKQTRPFTSARLITKGKAEWTYGRFEFRARVPNTAKGVWPALWMLPSEDAYGGWPHSGEIDIMEMVGFEPDRAYSNVWTTQSEAIFGVGNHSISETFGTDFHIFAVDWDPDSLVFWHDSTPVFTYRRGNVTDPKIWPFNKKFHLLMNVAVGGEWGGMQGIDTAAFPQRMEVDYVRVFKRVRITSVTKHNQSLGEQGLGHDLLGRPQPAHVQFEAQGTKIRMPEESKP